MLSFSPAVSVIIVAWNNERYLLTCLKYLSAQTYRNFEVVIVDNNNSDDANSEDFVKAISTFDVSVERLGANLGFAVANNIGVRLARGKWIALLNADAFPEPQWLEQLLLAANNNPGYTFFTSRQVQYNSPHLLDGTGDDYHSSGLAWRRSYNYLEKEYKLQQEEVFGACAAAAMYRKEDFLYVGGFDEDYFSYFEDVDLSFRLRLIGGRCLYVPQAVVYHVGSASTGKLSDFVIYYGHRNLVWTYFKNMPSLLFWLYFPMHVLMNFYFLISFVAKGKGSAIFEAKRDALRGIPSILRKRRLTQLTRKASILDIYRVISKGLFSAYWASRQRKLWVQNRPK